MRRMAMEKMMAEGPSVVSKMKKKDPMAMMDMEEDGEEQKGFVQMAVSPEEKEMILAARKEKDGEDMAESDEDESEYA